MSRILLIDDDINLLQMVRLMLQRVGHTVETSNEGEQGVVLAAKMQPDLAIIDVMMPGLSGYDVVRKLREDPLTANIPIIILTARSQPMDKHMALEAGANAFLSKPVTAQELTDRVDAVLKAGVNYRVHTGLLTEARRAAPATPKAASDVPPEAATATPTPPPPADASSPTPPRSSSRRPIGAEYFETPAPTPAPAEGRPVGADAVRADPAVRLPAITVTSLRGGTGSTTLAVNLAFLLASRGRRVCLVDLSTTSGHLALHLHLAPPQHWGQLLHMGDSPDPRAIAGLLVQHHGSGVSLLSAPTVPTMMSLSTDATQFILRELSRHFQHIVVDAPTLDPASLGAMISAWSVVMVMGDDPPSVQTAAQSLVMLQKMGVDMTRLRVALNHVRPAPDIPPDTIHKALKRPLSVELPYAPGQIMAIRRGVPLVAAEPEGAYAQAVRELMGTITT